MIGTTHDFEDWEAENEESGPMDVEHHSVASDEDAWGGVDDVPSSHAPNASTSVQPTRAPPTRDEIRTIREATDLFRSSTFKLQVRVVVCLALISSHLEISRSMPCCQRFVPSNLTSFLWSASSCNCMKS
jgi:hypothetical protein